MCVVVCIITIKSSVNELFLSKYFIFKNSLKQAITIHSYIYVKTLVNATLLLQLQLLVSKLDALTGW